MGTDMFLPMYFQGLYPTNEFNKIDLWSRDFYKDAVDFYSKKATSKQREQIIAGIKYLSYKIKLIDEFEYIGKSWDQANTLMFASEVFFKGAINLITEFRIEVSKILKNRKNEIQTKNERELKRLKEENTKNKILNDTLINEMKAIKKTQAIALQSFIIKNDDEMNKIYTICQDAFECEYLIFRDAIETADFTKLNIKRLNITQELTYRLADKMGKNWYSKVCETMKWEKSVCSKHGDKVKDDVLIKQLERILPRTIKRNRTK